MKKKLYIAKVKDYILRELYYIFYERVSSYIDEDYVFLSGVCSSYNKICHYRVKKDNERKMLYTHIVSNVMKNTNFKNKKLIKKSLEELIIQKFLMRDSFYKYEYYVLFCDKGKQHHLNEKSFEEDYINKQKINLALFLASLGIIIAPYVTQIFDFIKNIVIPHL